MNAGSLRIGHIACWQAALTLFGLSAGRPWPVAGPAASCAVMLLALTGLRFRNRWLYQWVWRFVRFRIRERDRNLAVRDGPRALLHWFAPDATLSSIRLGDGEAAVVSRPCGATAVLGPRLPGMDPVAFLPAPGELLPGGGAAPAVGVQLVLHGVAGNRRNPIGWIAVQAVRVPHRGDEDQLTHALGNAVERVLRELAGRDICAAGLDRTQLLSAVASLAHVRGRRGDVRERWRYWCCGSVVQAGFRLGGWAALHDVAARHLLRQLLTAATGAVVTVSVVTGESGHPAATMRVAASSVARLERSVGLLRALAAALDVRL